MRLEATAKPDEYNVWMTDDELSVTVEVVNKEPAENIPTIGRVDGDVTATNQDGTTVLTMVGLGLVKRREA